ncbi:MAG: phosphopantothenoylcysteine decarboxylase [Phycisphaerae bacterium]|nr:phosphopantothenoylcysteine decarboxylase [Phycisphaerae bacterium]
MADREVVVGVSGGIAAYKTAEVVSRLVQRGAGVTVAMTAAAREFVGPVTFQALSGRRVLTSMWTPEDPSDVQHIRRTDEAGLVLLAPATANLIGKIAAGIADDIVTTLVVSAASPVLIAPAMNARMWGNVVVQRNVHTLKELGFHFVGPGEGWLACRTVGAGRMAEPAEILEAAVALLKSAPPRPNQKG